MIFYTSDLHLLHERVIELCQRPFKNLDDMHEAIISNWNSKVSNKDTVYILGDIAFARNLEQIELAYNLINKLNGTKLLIRGNHDGKSIKNTKFSSLFYDIKIYDDIIDNGRRVILMHYPIEDWAGRHRGSYHLHGHVHNNNISNIERRYNCCMDVNDFEPKTLDELIVASSNLLIINKNKIQVFKDDIIKVYNRHGLALSHEDKYGAFEICKLTNELETWLNQANPEGYFEEDEI